MLDPKVQHKYGLEIKRVHRYCAAVCVPGYLLSLSRKSGYCLGKCGGRGHNWIMPIYRYKGNTLLKPTLCSDPKTVNLIRALVSAA